MNTDPSGQRYLCTICGRTSVTPGDCPDHPEEPLLDTSDRQVRFFLLHLDDQARNKAYGLWITLGLLLGAVGGIALAVIANSVLQDEVFGAGKVMVLGGIAGASLGTAIARWRFKPRFRAYTKPLEEVRPKA